MLLFQKLVDETQMPKPQKYTDTFILTKKLFLVGLRGFQNISNPVERPCIFGLKSPGLKSPGLKNSGFEWFQILSLD